VVRSRLGFSLPSSANGNCEGPLPVHWNICLSGAFNVPRVSGRWALIYFNSRFKAICNRQCNKHYARESDVEYLSVLDVIVWYIWIWLLIICHTLIYVAFIFICWTLYIWRLCEVSFSALCCHSCVKAPLNLSPPTNQTWNKKCSCIVKHTIKHILADA